MAFLLRMLPSLLGSGHEQECQQFQELHGAGIFDSIAHMIGLGRHHEIDKIHGSGFLNSVMGMFGLGSHPAHLQQYHALHGSGIFDSIAHMIGLGHKGRKIKY
jgi:hypothetical protein